MRVAIPMWSLLFLVTACSGDDPADDTGGGDSDTDNPDTDSNPDSDSDSDPDAPPCGAPGVSVGAAGGSVSSADGKLTLNIPAGALSADTVIHVGPRAPGSLPAIFADPPAALAWCLAPSGLAFASPVEVQLTLANAELPVPSGGSVPVMAIGVTNDAGDDVQLAAPAAPPEDLGGGQWRVTGSLTHFSSVAWLEGFRMEVSPECTTCDVGVVYDVEVTLRRSRPTVQPDYAAVGVGSPSSLLAVVPSENGATGVPGGEVFAGGVLRSDERFVSQYRCTGSGTADLLAGVVSPGTLPEAESRLDVVTTPITCVGLPTVNRRSRPEGFGRAPSGFAGRTRRAVDPGWFAVTYTNGFTVYDQTLNVVYDHDGFIGLDNDWYGVALLYEDGGNGTKRSAFIANTGFGGQSGVTAGATFGLTTSGGSFNDMLAFEAADGGTDGLILVETDGDVHHQRIQESEFSPGEFYLTSQKSSRVRADSTAATAARSAVGPDASSPILVATQGNPGKLFHVDWNSTTIPHPRTEVADVGDDPRQVRCTPDFTTCAVSAYGSSELTVVSWPNPANPPTLIGRVTVGDGPVGIDLLQQGADVIVASAGYNDDSLHLTRVVGTLLTDHTISLAGRCAQPGHTRFSADGTAVIVSCNGNGTVLTEPLP